MTDHPSEFMRLQSIELQNFRNYSTFSLDQLGDLTIFVGKNGIGKTNMLEAIALMTSTQSFRRGQIAQLMLEGSEVARVVAQLSDGNRSITNELLLQPGQKRYRLNGKAKKVPDVRGILPAVAFTPDDLGLAKQSSSVKRDALDDLGMQLTANYCVVRHDYEKVVRYKNRLLKDEAPDDLLDSIDEMVLTCGSQLFCYRVALAARLAPLAAKNYRVIAENADAEALPETLQVRYRASWQHLAQRGFADLGASLPLRDQVREWMAAALLEFKGQERARKRSLVGPHNDKIELLLDGRDAALFASQGQQRSIVLAWKLAEVACVRESLGINPVLLLDDVMSELDAGRRDMLVRFVTDEVQTFITATDLSGFGGGLLDRARVVELPLGG